MDNEEIAIDWEQEAVMYQKVLDVALEYQHQLEEKIEGLERALLEQEGAYQELQRQDTATLNELHFTREIADQQEQTIKRLEVVDQSKTQVLGRQRELITQSSQKIGSQEQFIRQLRAKLAERNKSIKRYQDRARKQKEAMTQQVEQIQRLTQGLQIQQRLLRDRRGTSEL